MAVATWHGAVLAESDVFETVEGNIYFPPDAINREHFAESALRTVCGWKGEANYYDLQVDGATIPTARGTTRSSPRRHEHKGAP